MDWDLTWEQKALIGVAAITILIFAFAFNPFKSSTDTSIQNRTYDGPLQYQSQPQTAPVNAPVNSNNTSNTTNSTSFNITAEKAKSIASQGGYTTGEPSLGSIVINNQTIQVWVVPLSKNGQVVKEVYVDMSNGNIVATRDISSEQINNANNGANGNQQ